MPTQESGWVQYDVKARPQAAAAMKAMAQRINGTPSNVLANGMRLYIDVKNRLLDQHGRRLLIQDPDGAQTEIDVS